MNQREADELKKLIDSFVEDKPQKVDEGKEDFEPEEKKEVLLTAEEEKQLFRNMIPDNFNWEEVTLIRSPLTQDRVFLKFGGERRWIPDLETLEKMGFTLNDVENIEDDEMRKLKEGLGLLSEKLWT